MSDIASVRVATRPGAGHLVLIPADMPKTSAKNGAKIVLWQPREGVLCMAYKAARLRQGMGERTGGLFKYVP
jgi:hypothetical protein